MTNSNLEVVHVKDSKAIKTIIFDKSKSQMFVKFANSPLYSYNVDEAIFNAFVSSDSKGKFYHQYIKNNFPALDRLDN